MLSYFLNPFDYLFGAMARRGTPNQVAMGATLGMILGVTPHLSGLWLVALLALLVFRVNLRIAIAMALIFCGLGLAVLDQYVSYPLGYWVIEQLGADGAGVGAVFKAIGENAALAWTGGHHWYAGGATLFALLLAPPFYWGMRLATTRLRQGLSALAEGTTIAEWRRRHALRWVLWWFAPSASAAIHEAVQAAQAAARERPTPGEPTAGAAARTVERMTLAAALATNEAQDAQARGEEPPTAEPQAPANGSTPRQPGRKAAKGTRAAEAMLQRTATVKLDSPSDLELESLENLDNLEDTVGDLGLVAKAQAPARRRARRAAAAALLPKPQLDPSATATVRRVKPQAGGGRRANASATANAKAEKRTKQASAARGRVVRRLFVVPLLLFVLLPAGTAAAAYLFRNTLIHWAIEGPVAAQMGLNLTLEGVDFDFGSGVATLTNVVLQPRQTVAGEAVNGIDPAQPLFRAAQLYAELDVEQLLQGRLHMTLRAVEPTLTLVRLPDGSMSYASATAPREPRRAEPGRPAEAAQPVRTPENEPATVVGPDGVERHVFRGRDGRRILAESRIGTAGEREWVWIDEHGRERRSRGDAPHLEAQQPEARDPESSSTLDEIRAFLEEQIAAYRLDDPAAWTEYAATATEYYEQYGPQVRKVLAQQAQNGTLQPEEVARLAQRLLVGSATYVESPVFEPGPNLPLVWLKELAVTDLTVNFVDLRPQHKGAWTQDGYSLDVRNLASDRALLQRPTVVLLSRGLAAEDARQLVQRAAEAETAATQAATAVQQAAEQAAAVALATRLHLHIERGLELNEVAGWFQSAGGPPPFTGGRIKIYTATPGFAPEDWYRPEMWYFDSRTGEAVAERARLPRGPVGFEAARMAGVVVLQLEQARLSAGAFGLPGAAIAFVNEVLGREAEADWRFVLEVTGPPHAPRVRLLNEAELLAKLRVLAVRAVTMIGQRVVGEVLRLLQPLIDWERFADDYLARPETYIIWEAGVANAAQAAARIAAVDGPARTRAEALVARLRNVVSPLLFADDKDLFLFNLGHNAAQILVVVARETFEGLADTVLSALLGALPLGERDGLSPAERQARFREQMIAGVPELLVPDLEVTGQGEVVLAGGAAYDVGQQARQALERFVRNANPVVEALIAEALEAGMGDAMRIVTTEFMPNATPAQREAKAASLRERLLVGVAEPLVPALELDAAQRIVLAGGLPYEQRVEQAVQRFRRNVGQVIGAEVTQLIRDFIAATTAEVEQALVVALQQVPSALVPRQFDPEAIPERLRDGLDLAVAPTVRVDGDLRVDFEFDFDAAQTQARAKLGENAVAILRELADGYLDEAVYLLDEHLGEYPADYPREQVRADVRDGVAEALVPHRTDERGMPVLTVQADAGRQRLVANLNRVVPRLAPTLVERLVAPIEQALDQVFVPIEWPQGWSPARVAQEVRHGVAAAYLTESPIRYHDGAYRLQTDRAAAVAVAERNAKRVATEVAALVVQALAEQVAEQVVALLPALPPGYSAQRVAQEVNEGVGEVVVQGETSADLRLDLDAGRAKLDANAVVVLRRMADGLVREPLEQVADALEALIDPLPAGTTRESLGARLGDGVGAALVIGERLSEVELTLDAGLSRLAINAVLLARELAEPMLAQQARRLTEPLAQRLDAIGEQVSLTRADWDRAVAGSVRGVGAVLVPLNAVEIDAEGRAHVTFKPDAAQRMLERNVQAEAGALFTLKWRRDVMQQMQRAIEPLLSEESRQARTETYWALRAVRVVPSTFGQRLLVAESDEQRRETVAAVGARLAAVLDEESAQAMLDQIGRLLASLNARVTPPLSADEMTAEEKRRYREAPDARGRMAVIRDVVSRTDRVLDAIGRALPGSQLLTPEQRRDRARDLVNGWR